MLILYLLKIKILLKTTVLCENIDYVLIFKFDCRYYD